MAPGPQEHTVQLVPAAASEDAPLSPDAIVVSGMSGLLPSCHNAVEFAEKLYNKENLVKQYEPRWKYSHPELPEHYGRVPGLNRFDAQFFMVHYRLGNTLDAMARKILENTYQAIFDAGISPAELSMKRVGVYIAVGATETEKGCAFSEVGLGILGGNRAMIANRVSYWLDVKGPSIVIDASCCGALVAFEKAYNDMASGACDAAIVGAGKVILHPQTLVHYHRLVPKNTDGKTKCYDMNADGQSSSEAIEVFLLQKHKDSKRMYASLCYAKTVFGVAHDAKYTEKYGPARDTDSYVRFLREFYSKVGIPPSVVEYVEGFGAALPEADKMELQAIDEVFCKDRTNPLLVGSVLSNIGYTEAASGSSAIMKILLGYQRGELAANLHCDSPRQDVAALREGRLRILTEHQRFKRSYAAVNGSSILGLNGHALLRGQFKPKNLSRYHSEIPYLVTVSGRQESAVQKLLDHFKSRNLDAEEIALLHNFHKYGINGHLARGFGIFSTNEENKTVVVSETVDYYDDVQRPLWFVYSGMGSQWAGMGSQLMRIPIFAAAIERCRKVLEPKGVDIIKIITSPDKNIFDNILNSFVGIAAIQIGLTDILTAIGLVPDKIIGHSVGELGCAYADGCLTAEEMILAAYSRGLVSLETPFIFGSMAAVGLGYKEISAMCPPEIEVACHNGPESSTISGPAAIMREFVAQLTSKGIFAKEVPCSNIAYHSRYIAKAGPGLLQYLSEVITEPKLRSERWVSTSVPQEKWNEEAAKYSSAEYHTNNLLSPVLFEETARLIPSNAVLVEIAPHGLLQAILKRSLPVSCKHVSLTRRGHTDSVVFLLEAIGKIYMHGYNPDLAALYPPVEFPVSTETSSMSHLIEWVYADHWNLCRYLGDDRRYSAVYNSIITVYDDEYLAGHIIEGSRLFPFAAVLVSVWDALAMSLSKKRRSVPVQYSDIHFYEQPRLLDHEALHLSVALQKGSGRFEVSYEYGLVADGYIKAVARKIYKSLPHSDENDTSVVTSDDIYKLLYERGYEYKENFRSIHQTNFSFNQAQLIWNNNWITFIDGLFQLNALKRPHTAISQPKRIKSLNIDLQTHFSDNSEIGPIYYNARVFEKGERIECGGVSMNKITFVDKPCIMRQSPDLKTLQFFPFFLQEDTDISTTLYVFMQIIAENLPHDKINVFELLFPNKPSIVENIKYLLNSPPEINHEVIRIKKSELMLLKNKNPKADVLIVHNFLSDKQLFEILFHCLPPNIFIVSLGVKTEELYPAALYRPVCVRGTGQSKIELALWRPSTSTSTTALTVRNSSEIDFLQSTCSNLPQQHRIVILTSIPPPLGLKDIVKQQKKTCDRNINVAMFDYKLANNQDLDHIPSFNLTYNVLDNGKWGGEYYLPLPKSTVTDEPVALRSTQIGSLDSLSWVEAPAMDTKGVAVTVHYAALNSYDAKRARAEIPIVNANEGYGMDFSGITDKGERVFGIVRNEAICTRVTARPELLWPVPEHWDLEDAATVPLPYLIAFYCLAIKTNIRKGMRVLIHGGAGALGQAAISIALAMNCQVFTTVSDIRKKKFLKQLFPDLKANYIGNSRDNSFSDMVLHATKGAGCDIIISNVQGELKNACLSCCASYGTTLDTVQVHTRENFTYGMFNMTKARSYVPIDFTAIFENDDLEQLQKLQLLISEGIARGYVRPLSRVTYPAQEASRAFRLLAASNHRGRVLLHLEDQQLATLAQPRLKCSPDKQQLLICDEEILGLQFADRLINRGAKRLRLFLQRPSAYLNVKIATWRQRGVNVDTAFDSSWKNEKLVEFLQETKKSGTVESIFLIIRDNPTGDQSTVKSIIQSLDVASRELYPSLKHFAVISESNFTGREICQDRALFGLPSLSLQLQNLDKYDEIGHVGSETVPHLRMKWQTAVEIIEQALCRREPVAFGYAKTKKPQTLLEELALIPGVSITSATDQRSTLEQVGVDEGRAQELCYLLQEKFNIVLPKESLPQMTIAKLKKLQERLTDIGKEETGIRAYFEAIDPDEMVSSTELVLKSTLITGTEMRSDEIDPNQTYLCIVPGVDGYHGRFTTLCERLKLPAAVIQPSVDVIDSNIQETAQRLVDVMMQRFTRKEKFYLLGYEMGVLLALEMAGILESYGLTGTVYCLGGTPDDIRNELNVNLEGMTEDVLQDSLVQHVTTLMAAGKTETLDVSALRQAKTLQDKINMSVAKIRGKVSYTAQFMRSYLKAAYNRIDQIRNHRAQPHLLRSKIVILRSNLSSNFDLSLMNGFSEQTIDVYELRSKVAQAPRDLQCTAVINKYLEPEILEKFHNSNLCDTYSLYSDDMAFEFANQVMHEQKSAE